jgi:lysophospholipase L1-like esterase
MPTLLLRPFRAALAAAVVALSPNIAPAQESLLADLNGDGKVVFAGFGDSITFGVGDGVRPRAPVLELPRTNGSKGYLLRVQNYLGVATRNWGVPGERLTTDGIGRVVDLASQRDIDVVGVLEGANDSVGLVDGGSYARTLQKAVNILVAQGKRPLLMTLPAPCCEHGSQAPITNSYSDRVVDIARKNELVVADLRRAWLTSCRNPSQCELYNLPEGLHPNAKGYDVMGQTVSAALLGIDPFTESGSSELAGAIGVDPSEIVVLPEGR